MLYQSYKEKFYVLTKKRTRTDSACLQITTYKGGTLDSSETVMKKTLKVN